MRQIIGVCDHQNVVLCVTPGREILNATKHLGCSWWRATSRTIRRVFEGSISYAVDFWSASRWFLSKCILFVRFRRTILFPPKRLTGLWDDRDICLGHPRDNGNTQTTRRTPRWHDGKSVVGTLKYWNPSTIGWRSRNIDRACPRQRNSKYWFGRFFVRPILPHADDPSSYRFGTAHAACISNQFRSKNRCELAGKQSESVRGVILTRYVLRDKIVRKINLGCRDPSVPTGGLDKQPIIFV